MSKIAPISPSQTSVGRSGLPGSTVKQTAPEGSLPSVSAAEGEDESARRLREMEARMTVLEVAILEHATILRDRIGQRLDRLEQKFRYEADDLRRALRDESSDRHHKIIQLTESFTTAVDRVESKQAPAGVSATVQDLIAALAATRTHLDCLAQAVTDKRRDLAS